MKLSSFLAAALCAAVLAPAASAQNLLANPDFELGGLAGWTVFGNGHPSTANPPSIVPLSGSEVCLMYGNFSGGFDVSGIFQEFACTPGEEFFMDSFTRHWSGDALTGTGVADFNWVVMKIAFFDQFATEIAPAAAESIVLDGTYATDVWHDNAPISATAPIGATSVQALMLFLQPFEDGGAAQYDDIFFGSNPPAATYPGSGEDIRLLTGLNSAGPTGAGDDIKLAAAGDFLEVNVSSVGGTFHGANYYLIGQLFGTGFPPGGFGGIWINTGAPFFGLVNPIPTPLGATVIPPGGVSTHVTIPPGLTGLSVMLQAFPLSPSAANGVFALSDAHEIQFL